MKKTILTIGLCIAAMLGIQAQNDYAGNYTRSLSDVMKDVEQRFGVRFKYNVDTAGVKLTFASTSTGTGGSRMTTCIKSSHTSIHAVIRRKERKCLPT